MMKTSSVLAASLLAMMAIPAMAQDQAQSKPDSIVLETKTGSVMTSTGGAYESVAPGKQLVEGESMMLTDGAKATVVYYYDNGKRKCVEKYAGPNTFVIDDSCKAVAWLTSNPRGTALVIGGAVVAAALLSGGNDDDAPVSAGAR